MQRLSNKTILGAILSFSERDSRLASHDIQYRDSTQKCPDSLEWYTLNKCWRIFFSLPLFGSLRL